MEKVKMLPTKGCLVSVAEPGGNWLGLVADHVGDLCRVRRPNAPAALVPADRLTTGLRPGDWVSYSPPEKPTEQHRRGEVVGFRLIDRQQLVLVEFEDDFSRVWLPHEILAAALDAKASFLSNVTEADQAELLRLRLLGRGLYHWHLNTGGLAHVDVDPLPHQLHLVDYILRDDNLNWLIADDVGLGKTIEVGLLISALRQRPGFDRILIVTPAGLTRQWKEELTGRFGWSEARILGDDFKVSHPSDWHHYNNLAIASIDRLKQTGNRRLLAEGPSWDLVVFDEAHRLTRKQVGLKVIRSDRFVLAQDLRKKTASLLFLSATPHQGDQPRFHALLELLRPEWREVLLREPERVPDLVKQCVFRNRKVDVTDAEGNFIFRGHRTHAVEVSLDEHTRKFDRLLREYLTKAARAAAMLSGEQAAAIGLVVVAFRKLAASSPAAIHRALKNRLAKKEQKADVEDERFEGEDVERLEGASAEFFEGEAEYLRRLIELSEGLRKDDRKLREFFEKLVVPLRNRDSTARLLVFTEYRATLECLEAEFVARFGRGAVVIIHGGLSHDERAVAAEAFTEGEAHFLVSTEAGGEGLNLHDRCHRVANFDLPWNPMRLVQRIGRVYRYGQTEVVQVFNVHAPHTVDAEIVQRMYSRLETVARDLAQLGGEFSQDLSPDILGGSAAFDELADILAQRTSTEAVSRTDERIEEALERARNAQDLQKELFSGAQHYSPNAVRGLRGISSQHILSFAVGMVRVLGGIERRRLYDGKVVEVVLGDELKQYSGTRGSIVRLTADRRLFRRLRKTTEPCVFLDINDGLFRHLAQAALASDFGRDAACVRLPGLQGFFAFVLRWQSLGGRSREDVVAYGLESDGSYLEGHPAIADWLLVPTDNAAWPAGDHDWRKGVLTKAVERAVHDLSSEADQRWYPVQWQLVGAVRCTEGDESAGT